MAQHDDITSLGWTGILAGGVLTAAALGLYQDGRYRKKAVGPTLAMLFS